MHATYITSSDYERLRLLLIRTPYTSGRRRDLTFLRGELDRASVVPDPTDRPAAIRLGSRFEFLDLQTRAIAERTLCMPDELPLYDDGVSIDSRFGTAVIGCSVGDEVRWKTAANLHRIVIRDIRPGPHARDHERAMMRPEDAA